ncbi:MAG: 50S ribosomal protein L23 [Candidatus Diapherotrites archaeon]|nr:50S ribosomal protein L23 [Candidatus Diapherotrites archaeon]
MDKAKTFQKNLSVSSLTELEILLHPLVSEKAVHTIESENKIVFNVHKQASKPEVKKVLESLYQVKVDKVNIVNDMKGRKKAIVKLKKEFKANDLATRLKII